MAIIKNNLTNTNEYLYDSNLSLSAKGLLTLLISLDDKFDLTMTILINLNKNGKESLKNALNELINRNYLNRLENRENDGRYRYDYVVYDKQKIRCKNKKER